MTLEAKNKLLNGLNLEDRYQHAQVRAAIGRADLSLNEQRELVNSLGGIYCDCVIPKPIGPAGVCPDCQVEGPFYRASLEYAEEAKKARMSENSEITGKYIPVDWHEAFRAKPSEVNWLFPPLIEAGTLNVLFGLPGVGKSLLVLDMVLEILREGLNVTIFDEENRVDEVVERLEKFGVTDPGELKRLSWYSFPQLPPLDTPEGGEHLTAIAERDEPALVVLDTTTRMIEGDENNASTWFQLYRNTLVPLKKRGIAVLRLDHQGKDPGKGQRGSSAKAGDVDTIWRLKFADDGYLALEREKTRNSHGEEWMLVERLSNPLRHVFKELDHVPVTPKIETWAARFDRWRIPRDAGRPTLRAAIQEHSDDEGISTTLLAMVAKYRKGLDSKPRPGYDPPE